MSLIDEVGGELNDAGYGVSTVVHTGAEFHALFTQKGQSAVALTKGDTLTGGAGEYVIHDRLGRGAVAQVWSAHRRSDRHPVAVKVVDPRPDLLNPTVFANVVRRFERERENGMKLAHPHVVRISDKGKYDTAPFLVMDLGERSAHEILTKRGKLDPLDALTVVRHAGLGLQHVHAANCIHRDVKPHNILEFAGRFVLGDLGIVQWSDMNPAFVSAGTITMDSAQLGSWHYMAPEQRRAPHEVTTASDVYGLGVTLYELLTASVSDPTAFAVGVFDPTGAGAQVDQLVGSMVKFSPTDRPSLDQVLAALERLGARP